MKKSAFLLGLVAIASLCLTACGNSKDYTMSFNEAYDIANHSALQDILINSENFQQAFNLSTNIDNWENRMDINLQSNSKQNLWNSKSESATTFDVNIKADDTNVLINWALDIRLLDNTIYLNLESLDISWPEDTSFLAAMVEWFKSQWFSIPMDGLNNMPSTLSYVKDAKNLNQQAKEIIVNEWSSTYNWKFTQFNGYNAWKFSLDSEKLQQLINDYYAKISESFDDEAELQAPELNIQNFEWYLVITGKNKVTTVIENMDMIEWETDVNINGFWGDDYQINASSNWESILTMKATKKNSNYNVSINAADSILLEWIVTPKVSSSKVDIKYDATLTVKSDYEETDDTILPLKGNWSYSPISDFSVEAPENAQDLTEMLSAYLWSALWWEEYNLEDYQNLDEEWATTTENAEEIAPTEATEESTEE